VTSRPSKGKVKTKADVQCRVQYQAVLDARRSIFDIYFADPTLAKQHQEAHQRLLEIEGVYSAVSGRREYRLFEMAFQLLADGLCQVACANYRLAFYCLRAFLELSVAGVRFSAFEYELREWEGERRDVSWAVLSGDETGCFSVNFANAFLPDIKDETKHYQVLARRVYRECSEYVHGNPSSHSSTASLDKGRTSEWFELFSAACTSVLFCFFVRYLKDLTSVGLRDELRLVIETELGHFSAVRSLIGGRGQNG
jgi:hypothetical protein